MIRRVRPPSVPPSLRAQRKRALESLREYNRRRAAQKSQRRWPIETAVVGGDDVVDALRELFRDKCAYCESPVERTRVESVWHRPAEATVQLDRTVSRDHYWWLAYDWPNLYLVCPTCRSHKSALFPTDKPRAPAESRGKALLVEEPLLLDPCLDEPTEHLDYQADGRILALTARGATTIDVLALNRQDLVSGRAQAVREVADAVEELPPAPTKGGPPAGIVELVAEPLPYLGIRRWALRRALLDRRVPTAWLAELGWDGEEAVQEPISNIQVPAAVDVLSRARLRAVTITNFKAIRDTTVRFPDPESEAEPWLLLLGENGVGKSTLLKAVALALVDDSTRRRLVPDASTCVRRGSRQGRVRLEFTDGEDVELRFRRDSSAFEVVGSTPPMVVLGYGPTRLPPPASYSPPPVALMDVENLFDPFTPLSDAEAWLADVRAVPTRRFNLHATSLKALLPMTPDDKLFRRNGRLYATSNGATSPLSELSDGFRSVIAMATDMTMQLSSYWESLDSAEGLLLVDEIEVHLHPQWRWSIVAMMRAVFPRLRVIATTHDPLCLQQMKPGEVMLLRRHPDEGVQALPLDVPPGLRADQLLTGDWFGLSTTTDADTAVLLERHGRLLVRPQTPTVRAERASVEDDLRKRIGSFAETSVERLAQQVAAEVAAAEAVDIKQADDQVRQRLARSVVEAVARKRATTR